MGDIFTSSDAQNLLLHKHVVILGDSNFRSIYKDIISLLQSTKFMNTSDAKNKGEFSCKGDTLLEGGRKGTMHNGTSYREKRIFKTTKFKVEFEFITRAFNPHVEGVLKSLRESEKKPDVLIVNSALWDMTRYGPNCVKEYKDNVRLLFNRISSWIAPFGTLVIWAAAPPISGNPSGALLVPEVDFLKDSLRMDVICANNFVADVATEQGLDFVDLHFFLRMQIHRRVKDGIHWDNTALRRVVNILLTHISEAWGVELPHRVDFMGEPIVETDVDRSETHPKDSDGSQECKESEIPEDSDVVVLEDEDGGKPSKRARGDAPSKTSPKSPSDTSGQGSSKTSPKTSSAKNSDAPDQRSSKTSPKTSSKKNSDASGQSSLKRKSSSSFTSLSNHSRSSSSETSKRSTPSKQSSNGSSTAASSRNSMGSSSSATRLSSQAPAKSSKPSPPPRGPSAPKSGNSSPAPRLGTQNNNHQSSSSACLPRRVPSGDFASDDISDVGFSGPVRSNSVSHCASNQFSSHHHQAAFARQQQHLMQMNPYGNMPNGRYHPYMRGGGPGMSLGMHFQGPPAHPRFSGPVGRGWGGQGLFR